MAVYDGNSIGWIAIISPERSLYATVSIALRSFLHIAASRNEVVTFILA